MKVIVDGELCDLADARVSPFDHGLLTGDGVFETMKIVRGAAFAIRRHLERLSISCKGLGIDCPDAEQLRLAVSHVIEANDLASGRVRITVTGGESPLGSDRGDTGPLVIVAAGPLRQWPATTDVVVVPWPRNERSAIAGLKTTSYAENVVALAYAKERGAGEAVFLNTVGRLCEGTGSNVFVVREGRMLTPPLSSGCLAGVTRALLLEVTDAREHDLSAGDLAGADEAFLTSSTRDVQPIRAVDGKVLGDAPGPRTRAAATAFAELVARDLDP